MSSNSIKSSDCFFFFLYIIFIQWHVIWLLEIFSSQEQTTHWHRRSAGVLWGERPLSFCALQGRKHLGGISLPRHLDNQAYSSQGQQLAVLGSFPKVCGQVELEVWGRAPPPRAYTAVGPWWGYSQMLLLHFLKHKNCGRHCFSQLRLSYQNAIDWVAWTTDVYFLIVLEAGGPRWDCPQGQILLRAPVLACRGSLFFMSSHSLSLVHVCGESIVVPLPLLIEDSKSILGAPCAWPHLNQITSQRPHFLLPSHWGQEFNIRIWGTQFSCIRSADLGMR